MANDRVENLDGWRAISVLLVIFGHVLHLEEAKQYLSAEAISRLGRYAFLGVDIFFVISGFVITRSLLRENARGGDVSLRAFYVRRACRILPPLILYLLALTLLSAAGVISHSGADTLAALLFLCNTAVNCAWHTGHIWSLSFEEQFYAAFPVLLLAFLGRRLHWLTIPAALVVAIPLIAPAQWLGRAAFFQAHALLIAGAVAAFWPTRRLAWGWIWVAVLVMVAVPQIEGWIGRVASICILPLAICAVLLYSGPQRPLTARPIVYIGAISYSIYMWQQLALSNDLNLSAMGRLAAICGAIVLAAASFHLLERPFQRIGQRYSARVRKNCAFSATE